MVRRTGGSWLTTAADMAERRAEAVRLASPDPIAVVARDLHVERSTAKRMLDAYDLVAPHAAGGEIKASFGSVEAWRRLSAIDPQRASSMWTDLLEGAYSLSTINDIVSSVRESRAIAPGIAALDVEGVLRFVMRNTGLELPWEEPKGIAERIRVDLEYRDVYVPRGSENETPRFSPAWALLVSPWLTCSRSSGVPLHRFAESIMCAVAMYRTVFVACSSAVEEEALRRDLDECEFRASQLRLVVLE